MIRLTDHEINYDSKDLLRYYKEMYKRWSEDSENGFYEG